MRLLKECMVSLVNELSLSGVAAQPPEPDIGSAAVRLGRYGWVAARMFETVGAWVASTPEPEVKVFFGTVTAEWAWHAELWRERLPELREIDRSALLVSPGAAADRVFALLEGLEATASRLAGLDALCARLEVIFTIHEQAADTVRDAPTLRTLRLVQSDLASSRAKIAELQETLVTPDTLDGEIAEEIRALDTQLEQTIEAICAKSPPVRA